MLSGHADGWNIGWGFEMSVTGINTATSINWIFVFWYSLLFASLTNIQGNAIVVSPFWDLINVQKITKPFECTEQVKFTEWAVLWSELEHALLDVSSHPLSFSHCEAHYSVGDVVCCPQAYKWGKEVQVRKNVWLLVIFVLLCFCLHWMTWKIFDSFK